MAIRFVMGCLLACVGNVIATTEAIENEAIENIAINHERNMVPNQGAITVGTDAASIVNTFAISGEELLADIALAINGQNGACGTADISFFGAATEIQEVIERQGRGKKYIVIHQLDKKYGLQKTDFALYTRGLTGAGCFWHALGLPPKDERWVTIEVAADFLTNRTTNKASLVAIQYQGRKAGPAQNFPGAGDEVRLLFNIGHYNRLIKQNEIHDLVTIAKDRNITVIVVIIRNGIRMLSVQ